MKKTNHLSEEHYVEPLHFGIRNFLRLTPQAVPLVVASSQLGMNIYIYNNNNEFAI